MRNVPPSGTMAPALFAELPVKQSDNRPIGVFDSGVGGLTVLHAARDRLPRESFVYLGDTARLPYGTKSPATVLGYARRAAAYLGRHDIKLLIVACNTASAVALPDLAAALAPMPVIGVVGPGAEAAVAAVPGGRHLVLATEATVRLRAYKHAVTALDTTADVAELPCEMLVALAEEGWHDDPIARDILRRYLLPYLARDADFKPDSIILGCTHFPLLRAALREVVGETVSIVDSAATTAVQVERMLDAAGLRTAKTAGSLRLLATDGARRFARVGGLFLGETLSADDIELTDL